VEGAGTVGLLHGLATMAAGLLHGLATMAAATLATRGRRRWWSRRRPEGGGGDPREATLVEPAVLLAIPHGTEARRWRAVALWEGAAALWGG